MFNFKKIKHQLLLGSLLFGLFFGAGNLIFPVNIGQLATTHSNTAALGFILSATVLTALAVISVAISNTNSLEELVMPYGKIYARAFTILLLMTIGPIFALPRTATVPYEVGIKVLLPNINHQIGLLIYSSTFFLLALLLSLKPNKIKDLIGKYINPIFLVCLILFFISFFINPMGNSQSGADIAYQNNAFLSGFSSGYQTMDVLAALSFGFVIINVIDNSENSNNKIIDIIVATVFAATLMAIIYYVLINIGASSRNIFEVSENGGVALGLIFKHYFKTYGALFLSLTITLACLKTAIGLIVATSSYFSSIIAKISYQTFVWTFSIVAFIVSNIGLNQIIVLAIPILNFIYPLAIMHVLVGLTIKTNNKIYNYTILSTTLLAAFIELLITFPNLVSRNIVLASITNFYKNTLPLANIGLSWLNFSLLGLIIAFFINHSRKKR